MIEYGQRFGFQGYIEEGSNERRWYAVGNE
jgi:hypothetical protein